MEIKVIYQSAIRLERHVKKAIAKLNAVQNYFHFSLSPSSEVDLFSNNLIDWEDFCKGQDSFSEDYRIYITGIPFDDNWFSHEEHTFSLITTYDWERLYAPPSLFVYLSYQIIQAAINFKADMTESMELRMVHQKAKGCVFDFCSNKPEIKIGMTAGTICPDCRSLMHQYGVEDGALNAIERVLHFVRLETIGKPMTLNESDAFVVMRFTKDDENDNAFKYGIKAALADLNIKCIRSDNSVASGQILNKIQKGIEKSRFIIVKVDSDNLNVFFELGLAMGMDKDVLLISEESLVLQLPSDLRNWECLTYPKGNYEALKKSVVKFYRDNYYY